MLRQPRAGGVTYSIYEWRPHDTQDGEISGKSSITEGHTRYQARLNVTSGNMS